MKIDQDNFVDELINKNEKALDYIYSKYVALVYKVVLDVLKNTAAKEDIEECVSDIFVGIWNNVSKYNPNITSFQKWLIAVSKYKAIDYKRKISRTHETLELDEEMSTTNTSLEDKLLKDDDITTLYKLIATMNDIDKQIFVKRYIHDEKIEDIANNLNMSRSNIDNRLSRGRKSIKNKWQELMGR